MASRHAISFCLAEIEAPRLAGGYGSIGVFFKPGGRMRTDHREALLDFLLDAVADEGITAFPVQVLASLRRVVRCAQVAYFEWRPEELLEFSLAADEPESILPVWGAYPQVRNDDPLSGGPAPGQRESLLPDPDWLGRPLAISDVNMRSVGRAAFLRVWCHPVWILIIRWHASPMYQRSGGLLYQIEQAVGARRSMEALLNAAERKPQASGESMDATVGRDRFWEMFKGRALVVSELPAGHSRVLATVATQMAGRDGTSLRTKAEYLALYDFLVAQVSPAPSGKLRLLDEAGRPTAAARAVEDYVGASLGKREFFGADMYTFHVTGFRPGHRVLTEPVKPHGARLDVWKTDPADHRRIPALVSGSALFSTQAFTLKNSGNRTLRAPKRSWRVILDAAGHGNRLAGMTRINLKAMYNDPSQMREALAWRLFGIAGIPASRHTYAKLAFDATYRGLFSVIEHVDKKFLRDHFGENYRGNLYKTGCRDIGCASLAYRTGPDGNDSGRQYFIPGPAERTYRLKTNKNNPEASTYDDLACFIRTINGIGLPGGEERFDTDAFRESVDGIMNVNAFLRWAAVNMLLGSWDNYYATPSNYYLYNSGHSGAADDFVSSPYFHFIPWDYDNCLGIDYFGTRWQYADILDWPGKANRHIPKIPLVRNLLSNHDYRRYYLDYMEHMLDTEFNPRAIAAQIGTRSDDGLWHRVRQAAYLESATPYGRPFTGRRYSNHEVYQSGCRHRELQHGKKKIDGIVHYVRMRHDSARAQLKRLRRTMPRTVDGFPSGVEQLPRAA
jgi:hypothetical protein